MDGQHTCTNNLQGYNSHGPPGPRHYYQIDLFMTDLKDEEQQKLKLAMCAIDSFTCLTGVPLKAKREADFLARLTESFKNLGGRPSVIYVDQEPSWSGKCAQQVSKEEIFN